MPRPAQYGETLAREVDLRIAAAVANTAAITALPAADRVDGLLILETTNGSSWWFDDDSTAVAGPSVLVPDAGSGRWLATGGSVASGVGAVNLLTVRGATTANIADLAVFTVAAVDGLTYTEGQRILVKNQTATEDNGPYRVGAVALGTAALTRVGEADASAEVTAGMLIWVSEGSAGGDKWFYLTTNDAIVLGTTSLTYVQTPTAVELASVETRLSSTEVIDSQGDSSLTLITSSVETRLSSTEVVDSDADSSLTLITSSIETRLSSTEVVDSDADSSLTLITSSIETRLSSTEVVDSDADSSLTLITSSIETRLSSTEVVDSTADSSLTVSVGTLRPGVPMINRLVMLGAPGAIAEGDTVTIGGDVYEFRSSNTPPIGGTAGRIWVYQGGDSAASRVNFINAVNNVVDAVNIAYDGAVTESMIAVAGTTLGTVDVRSAVAIGGAIGPSAVATATTEVLTEVGDVWDEVTMYGGQADGPTQLQMTTVTLSAGMINQGFLEVEFDFTPTVAWLMNRNRAQDEAYTITANRVVLTLAGGGAPNNQAADVLDIVVQA